MALIPFAHDRYQFSQSFMALRTCLAGLHGHVEATMAPLVPASDLFCSCCGIRSVLSSTPSGSISPLWPHASLFGAMMGTPGEILGMGSLASCDLVMQCRDCHEMCCHCHDLDRDSSNWTSAAPSQRCSAILYWALYLL